MNVKRITAIISVAAVLLGCVLVTAFGDGGTRYLGDLNGDGKLNARDVTALMKAIVSGAQVDMAVADYTRDGKLNARDVTAVMKAIVRGDALVPATGEPVDPGDATDTGDPTDTDDPTDTGDTDDTIFTPDTDDPGDTGTSDTGSHGSETGIELPLIPLP